MSSLAELPEIVGFFSYSREDDEDSENALSMLRTRIQNELRSQLGRSKDTLRLWQDREAIPPGTLWGSQIDAAVNQAVFFVPIVTPRVLKSEYCGQEFKKFLDRERELKRTDLLFPVLYIDVHELENEKVWRQHSVLRVIGERQYVDWRHFRYDPNSPDARRAIAAFCKTIATALRRSIATEEATMGSAAPLLTPNSRQSASGLQTPREDTAPLKEVPAEAQQKRAEIEPRRTGEEDAEVHRRRDEETLVVEPEVRRDPVPSQKLSLRASLEWAAVSIIVSLLLAALRSLFVSAGAPYAIIPCQSAVVGSALFLLFWRSGIPRARALGGAALDALVALLSFLPAGILLSNGVRNIWLQGFVGNAVSVIGLVLVCALVDTRFRHRVIWLGVLPIWVGALAAIAGFPYGAGFVVLTGVVRALGYGFLGFWLARNEVGGSPTGSIA